MDMPEETYRISPWNDRSTRLGMVLVGLMLLLEWGLVAGYYRQLPPEIPLFYSQPLGAAQLATRPWILLIPGLGMVFSVLAWLVLRMSFRMDAVFNQIVIWMLVLLQLLGMAALLHTLILVF